MSNMVVIVPAAGLGLRMNSLIRKQYLLLQGQPVLTRTLQAFEQCSFVTEIIPVMGPGEETFGRRQLLEPYDLTKIKQIAAGGKTRQQSVFNALQLLPETTEYVAVHDGVRPLVTTALIKHVFQEARLTGAAVAAVPVKDTVKLADDQQMVLATPDRTRLWAVQTPQVFKYSVLLEAYQKAVLEDYQGTDDASLVEHLGYPVRLVAGSYSNIKITTQEDLFLAEIILTKGLTE